MPFVRRLYFSSFLLRILPKLVEEGNAFLVDQKWDEAIRSGRVALKAKAGYNPARILMARAYMGKGVMDKAQQFAEDALAAKVVKMRYFIGLSMPEIAEALEISPRSADRHWSFAKAWLKGAIRGS